MASENGQKSEIKVSRLLRYALVYVCLASALLLSGLQHFVLTLPNATGKQLQYTDGIVVMTGGQKRLDDGLHLLTEGIAGKMLISGVGDGVSRAVLVQQLDLDERQINALFCCVDLDFSAEDTRGNARAARRWAAPRAPPALPPAHPQPRRSRQPPRALPPGATRPDERWP